MRLRRAPPLSAAAGGRGVSTAAVHWNAPGEKVAFALKEPTPAQIDRDHEGTVCWRRPRPACVGRLGGRCPASLAVSNLCVVGGSERTERIGAPCRASQQQQGRRRDFSCLLSCQSIESSTILSKATAIGWSVRLIDRLAGAESVGRSIEIDRGGSRAGYFRSRTRLIGPPRLSKSSLCGGRAICSRQVGARSLASMRVSCTVHSVD